MTDVGRRTVALQEGDKREGEEGHHGGHLGDTMGRKGVPHLLGTNPRKMFLEASVALLLTLLEGLALQWRSGESLALILVLVLPSEENT